MEQRSIVVDHQNTNLHVVHLSIVHESIHGKKNQGLEIISIAAYTTEHFPDIEKCFHDSIMLLC